MYNKIEVCLDHCSNGAEEYPLCIARGIKKTARSNSSKWHKDEYVEVCAVDQEADEWYKVLSGFTFTSIRRTLGVAPEPRYFSITNYRERISTYDALKQVILQKDRTLLTIWEIIPGKGAISGPVYVSGARAKKIIKMLTGHEYKVHNED